MTLTGKALLAAVAFAALSGSAMAADLYVPPAAAPVAAAAPATNWDGPYIGATLGYGWYDPGTTNGWDIGAQVGYNAHLSDAIVVGIQGNVDWVGFGDNGNFNGANNANGWDGAIVGRLGYDAGTILPYVEAGVAFLGVNNTAPGYPNSYTGWTAGAGVEFMLTDSVSANVEYRYVDYGQGNNGGLGYDLHANEIRVGLNYHF
jgi:outer membrane immunogenic protein